jgi:hypothetical protein
MIIDNLNTLLPDLRGRLDAAQLPGQNGVEVVEMRLGPSDAGAAHGRREALLEGANGVAEEGEEDKGDLEDIEGEIAFEEALSGEMLAGKSTRDR